MVTADIFEKLKELQDVLVQKYELEAKVEEAPKQLSAQDELLARLKKERAGIDIQIKAFEYADGENTFKKKLIDNKYFD